LTYPYDLIKWSVRLIFLLILLQKFIV
jgi:hypothetical protein